MILNKIYEQDLITPPYWLPNNTQYLVLMGSHCYGLENKDSDFDYFGFCVPPREFYFPYDSGYIIGYDELPEFISWNQHHIIYNNHEYDFNILSITHYFKLLTKNNPNIIDSLFVPQSCVSHCTTLAQLVRDNRKIFLHKGLWDSFRGYAYTQKTKMINRNSKSRQELVSKHSFDTKYAYHLIRLLSECEQLLNECDLDLQEPGRKAHLKSIKNGEVSLQEVLDYFSQKEKHLEQLYTNTKLPNTPDYTKIRSLLINCLEHHYGRIQSLHHNVSDQAIKEIKEILQRNNL